MDLWTEYEGITIDGAFLLQKLLLPEGRSAFFSTANGNGEPTLIRLIACHFDEDEILARWRGVEALNHPNFLKLERYGQLVLDDVTVVYAAFERADANLAEAIRERRLTASEALDLAASLASALQTLHANGFVHEHVDPANVFAVGDFVKLRSDCIRETPEGEKGLEAKRQDAHDLALLLLQALTQERNPEGLGNGVALPEPFESIVRNGISGAWGIEEMAAALQSAERPSRLSSRNGTHEMRSAVPEPVVPAAETVSSPGPAVREPVVPATETFSSRRPAATEPRGARVLRHGDRLHLPLRRRGLEATLKTKWIGAAALAVFVLILALWLRSHFEHREPVNQNTAAPAIVPEHDTASPARAGVPTARPRAGTPQNAAVPGSREQWRVVAYTYNRADQAQKKSGTVARAHPELRPEVFSPRGHAPFLVTVGGAMDRDEAFAFALKARKLGLPRDTYAQNYGGTRR